MPELRPLLTGFAMLFATLMGLLYMTGGRWQGALLPIAAITVARLAV